MKQLIIIKLGGSVITAKEQSQAIAQKNIINNLAKQIAKLYQSNNYKIILVHGGGSFAHPLAKKYELNTGIKVQEQKLGLSLTQKALVDLNTIIIKYLHKYKIPAVVFPPHAILKQSSSKLTQSNSKLIRSFTNNKYVPILHGDVVFDDKIGCSIISGDTITTYLAQSLHAAKVIFLSDVNGIFDSNPKTNPEAKLITDVNNANVDAVLQNMQIHNLHDITDEMKGKILSIKNHLKNTEVIITNGLKKNCIIDALSKKSLHTRVYFE